MTRSFVEERNHQWAQYAKSKEISAHIDRTWPRGEGFDEGFMRGYYSALVATKPERERRLLQDETQTHDSKALSQWFASRPNARQEVREVALSRASDPQTSKDAAKVVQVGKLKDLIIDTLTTKGPATAAEIAQRLGRPLNAISPRFAPLVRQNIVRVWGVETGKHRAPRTVYCV